MLILTLTHTIELFYSGRESRYGPRPRLPQDGTGLHRRDTRGREERLPGLGEGL